MGLKTEAEIGSNFLENMGVKIRDVSCSTGSVNLSEINKEDKKDEKNCEGDLKN